MRLKENSRPEMERQWPASVRALFTVCQATRTCYRAGNVQRCRAANITFAPTVRISSGILDIMYVWVAAQFYFLLSFVDAYIRYIVHHKLLCSSVSTDNQSHSSCRPRSKRSKMPTRVNILCSTVSSEANAEFGITLEVRAGIWAIVSTFHACDTFKPESESSGSRSAQIFSRR